MAANPNPLPERPRGPITVEYLRRVCECAGYHVTMLGDVDAAVCAKLIDLSEGTLRNMRHRGEGPHSTYAGRVRYALPDIVEWYNRERDWGRDQWVPPDQNFRVAPPEK